MHYSKTLIQRAIHLRSDGYTYSEINKKLNTNIPKGTFNAWFKDIPLSKDYYIKIKKFNEINSARARIAAIAANKAKKERYWMDVTRIPKRLFYKARVDPRTVGKPTNKENYKGVLKVNYMDTKVQLDLESLADLVYN